MCASRRVALGTPLVVLLLAAPLAAQQPALDFSIGNLMRGPELYGREPSQVRWSVDGQWLYFRWNTPGTSWREPLGPYRVRARAGAVPERLSDAQMDSAGPLVAAGALSPDRLRRVAAYAGDIYLIDLGRAAARRLTETLAAESNPRFSSDGQRIVFIRDGNAFSLDLATGATKQLTDIRAGPPPDSQKKAAGQRAAIERDQLALFEAIRDREHADSVRKAEQKAREELGPAVVWLERDERVVSIAVSPAGNAALVTTRTRSADARTVQVPAYVTSSGYTEEIASRTKVGDAQGGGRLGFQQLPRGEIRWLKAIGGDSASSPYTSVVGWNDAGGQALVVSTARDWKTRQLSVVDGTTGALTPIDVLRDSAWVGGPCDGCAGWYDGDRRIWFVSEATGYAQLHSTSAGGSDRRALTNGTFEIYDVALSNDRTSFLFHSSEVSAFDRDFWRMSVDGGPRQRLTTGAGGHQVVLSPDERRMADIYSRANRPPELFLGTACPARAKCDAAAPMQLTTSPTKDWLAHDWISPEIVSVPASDGAQVPARIYRPRDVGARPNGAAVIFVHGAGYLHNVHHYWSSYPREYMFNHFLASKGYVVLDLDYRGSAGYGRDWRTAIYRWMGGRDLGDEVDGSKYLQREHGIDPERIGIYGGSYGGFMTLMALFTAPKEFGAGAALRSVTDWAAYNHEYTSQILNAPQDDTLAFHRSSPIFFAQGLEDPLLMAHGMADTNVHFQDIVRLTQRFIELGKSGWELAVYPVEDHGFVRPSSWADEYGRIFGLFERTIGPNGSKVKR